MFKLHSQFHYSFSLALLPILLYFYIFYTIFNIYIYIYFFKRIYIINQTLIVVWAFESIRRTISTTKLNVNNFQRQTTQMKKNKKLSLKIIHIVSLVNRSQETRRVSRSKRLLAQEERNRWRKILSLFFFFSLIYIYIYI